MGSLITIIDGVVTNLFGCLKRDKAEDWEIISVHKSCFCTSRARVQVPLLHGNDESYEDDNARR